MQYMMNLPVYDALTPGIHNPTLLPQLPKTNLLIIMFIQHLRRREIKVLLRHMHPPLPQSEHPGFGTYTLQLGARAAVHLLGDLEEVDPPGEVHAAGVDAQDVGAGFDAVGGGGGLVGGGFDLRGGGEGWWGGEGGGRGNSRRRREFDLAIDSAGPQERWI